MINHLLFLSMALGLSSFQPSANTNCDCANDGNTWYTENTGCYHFGESPMDFHAGDLYCQSLNASLVQIGSAAEQEFIKNHINSFGNDRDYLTGLTDFGKNNTFKWVSSQEEATYTAWAGNNHADDPNLQVVIMSKAHNYAWEQKRYDESFYPICECNQ